MPPIKVYTTSQCGDCRAVKRFLSERSIPYEEINIEQVDGAAEIVLQVNQGRRSVPTLDIDGKFVSCSPFDRRKLSEALGIHENYAKQLALIAVGKTPVIYAGSLMFPAAYKWKISWNENAKNVAFCDEIPEFNHNEFIGWTSHPIEKPFVIFDLLSSLEHPRILKRFEITDRLLSGMRPKANAVQLKGDSVIKQLLWASILADFVSIYVAILNGVNPTPVDLVEKLKHELAR